MSVTLAQEMRSMSAVHQVADCLEDGGSFSAFSFYEHLREGKQAGVWSLMICELSVWIQAHSAENLENSPIHQRKVFLGFSPLPRGESHILLYSLIDFWK